MKILFVHQNMPGQFRHLASYLSHTLHHEVAFIGSRNDSSLSPFRTVRYKLESPKAGLLSSRTDGFAFQVRNGQAVIHGIERLAADGFVPDIFVGHPGWGELLFIKDLLPSVPLISYSEFYYNPELPYFGGDPPRSLTQNERTSRRAQSAHLLLSLDAADLGWSPTHWQRLIHPKPYHNKIAVAFDGVDTERIYPNHLARLELPGGDVIHARDEIVTYAARSLEPTRGFPSFYRSIPSLLRRRPQAHVVIAGSPEPHYDAPPAHQQTWMQLLIDEVGFDAQRVHFVGSLSREDFTSLLQVSSVHLYLSTPTVLSWSAVEAMSAGCLVVASDTPPVREIFKDGLTAILTDFFSPEQIAADIASALVSTRALEIRNNARRFATSELSLRVCLPRIASLIEGVAKLVQPRE